MAGTAMKSSIWSYNYTLTLSTGSFFFYVYFFKKCLIKQIVLTVMAIFERSWLTIKTTPVSFRLAL